MVGRSLGNGRTRQRGQRHNPLLAFRGLRLKCVLSKSVI
nr:MAG TPA_asm: hypothetical protein [Caudoviricetes sp.]